MTQPGSRTRVKMAQALVDGWVSTRSFDGARQNYSFLRKLPHESWTQGLVHQVAQAARVNPQLASASIDWEPCDKALEKLFCELPFQPTVEIPSAAVALDDDIPVHSDIVCHLASTFPSAAVALDDDIPF